MLVSWLECKAFKYRLYNVQLQIEKFKKVWMYTVYVSITLMLGRSFTLTNIKREINILSTVFDWGMGCGMLFFFFFFFFFFLSLCLSIYFYILVYVCCGGCVCVCVGGGGGVGGGEEVSGRNLIHTAN